MSDHHHLPIDDEGFIDPDDEAAARADHWADVADRERDLRWEGRRAEWDAADDAAEGTS